MGKIEAHREEIERIVSTHRLPAHIERARSRHGRYLRIETEAKTLGAWRNALRLADELRRYAKGNKLHLAMDVRVPGGNKAYILHIPFNYAKGPYKLPKIHGETLHHVSRIEQPGKVAIALPIAKDRRIFDDVGIIVENENGQRPATDYDVLRVDHGPNGLKIHIGEVLTDHYDRIGHKAKVWKDFINHLRKTGIPVETAAPIIFLVADPLTLEEKEPEIRDALRKNGFKNHGFIKTSYTNYKQWENILRSAARLKTEDHGDILKPAQRALVMGDTASLTNWATLFEAIESNVKHINKGIRKGKWQNIQIETLRFPEHLTEAQRLAQRGKINEDALTHAIRRVMWGIVQHLPPDAANGLKKRFGKRPL